MIRRIAAALLAAITVGLCLFSCGDGERAVLKIGIGCISGNVIPYSDMTDGDEALFDMVYSKLVSIDADGSIVCGDSFPTAAKSFRVFYTDESFNEGTEQTAYTAFEFTLKNGMMFSDGSDLTAEDVLFSLYYYIDPACKSGVLSALPIAGLENYLYQRGDMSEFLSLSVRIAEKGAGYAPTEEDPFTAEQAQVFWSCFDEAGDAFAGNIVSYVESSYCTDELVSAYIMDGVTAEELTGDRGMLTAYAMMLWNYGSFIYSYEADENGEYVAVLNEDGSYTYKTTLQKALEEEGYCDFVADGEGEYYYDYGEGKYIKVSENGEYDVLYSKVLSDKYTVVSKSSVNGFRDIFGKSYTPDGEGYPDISDFFSVMKDYYTDGGIVDFKRLESTEAAFEGDSVFEKASVSFAEKLAAATSQPSVKGIVKGVADVSGEQYETVTVYLEGALYDSIGDFDIYILSEEHMTEGFDAQEGTVSAYGMPLNSEAFASHVKDISVPLGSGPYVLASFSEDGGSARLGANSQFYSMGGADVYNPLIPQAMLIQVPVGEEVKMTENGELDICLVYAAADDVPDNVTVIKSDYPSYDCVVVNPAYYLNINTRKAIFSLLDTSVLEGERLRWSLPDFMWASPDTQRESLYDESLESARGYFAAAGYTFGENGEMTDPSTKKQAEFTFTLLPTESGGKTAAMLEKAAEHLKTLGALGEVVYDSELMYNIYSDSGVAIYAMGWDIGRGTGLFDRYALSSESDAVKANGIKALSENALLNGFGTVETENLSGETVTLNESEAVYLLDTLLTQGRGEVDINSKKDIYSKALNLISDLYFELPLTGRSRQILVGERVDCGSLFQESSYFRSVISEPWKIRLKGTAEPGDLTSDGSR